MGFIKDIMFSGNYIPDGIGDNDPEAPDEFGDQIISSVPQYVDVAHQSDVELIIKQGVELEDAKRIILKMLVQICNNTILYPLDKEKVE